MSRVIKNSGRLESSPRKNLQSCKHDPIIVPSEDPSLLEPRTSALSQHARCAFEALHLASPKAFPTLTSGEAPLPFMLSNPKYPPLRCKPKGLLSSYSCGHGWPLPSASGFRHRVIGARGSFARVEVTESCGVRGLPGGRNPGEGLTRLEWGSVETGSDLADNISLSTLNILFSN
jgi:hypothetical protein